jgi:hypothetical protein
MAFEDLNESGKSVEADGYRRQHMEDLRTACLAIYRDVRFGASLEKARENRERIAADRQRRAAFAGAFRG